MSSALGPAVDWQRQEPERQRQDAVEMLAAMREAAETKRGRCAWCGVSGGHDSACIWPIHRATLDRLASDGETP